MAEAIMTVSVLDLEPFSALLDIVRALGTAIEDRGAVTREDPEFARLVEWAEQIKTLRVEPVPPQPRPLTLPPMRWPDESDPS